MSLLAVTPILVAAAVGLAPAAASGNGLAPGAAAPRLTINAADLDLTTTDGRATLDRRIARTAASLCDPIPAARSPSLDAERESCMKATIAGTRSARRALIAADYRTSSQSASIR
jgi:UrcA family protein